MYLYKHKLLQKNSVFLCAKLFQEQEQEQGQGQGQVQEQKSIEMLSSTTNWAVRKLKLVKRSV